MTETTWPSRPETPPPRYTARMNAHPHFDDRGTLNWHTRLNDALAAAKAEGKKVFIEFGREM